MIALKRYVLARLATYWLKDRKDMLSQLRLLEAIRHKPEEIVGWGWKAECPGGETCRNACTCYRSGSLIFVCHVSIRDAVAGVEFEAVTRRDYCTPGNVYYRAWCQCCKRWHPC